MPSDEIHARLLQALQAVVGESGDLDPAALARIVADQLRDQLTVDGAILVWHDPAQDLLTVLAHNLPGLPAELPALALDHGALGAAFTSRQPVVVADYPTWSRAILAARRAGVISCLAVPLLFGTRSVGALEVVCYRPHTFSASDLQLVAVIGAQLGIVLEAVRLHRESRRHRQESERLADQLARSEQELRSLYNAIACGILVRDASGRIVHANAAAAEILGLSVEKMCGHTSDELWSAIAEDGTALEAGERPGMVALRAGTTVRNVTMGIRRRSGEVRWLQITSVPIADATGRPVRVVSSFIDVTALKEAERQLRSLAQSEKLRALGQLASGVAHDLNQSLALITGHGELALRALDQGSADPERLRESLHTIIEAATDGAATIKNLLTFSRPRQSLTPVPVDLGEVLGAVARLTAPRWRDGAEAEGRPIALSVVVDGETTIEGFPDSLREAFTNLVLNAVDALPRGGAIRLAARRRSDVVEAEVSDTGVGMPREVQNRIFEPFFTTKGDHGSGLGLAVVYGIVEQHGGQIVVESIPGQGTTFRLTFRAAATAAPTPACTKPDSTVRPLQILAVDDEPALAKMIALMLAPGGHRVIVARSGEEALERLAAEPFDLVISDIAMGTGMNGWELAHRVQEEFPTVRVCLATGWGAQIDLEQARAHGVHAVIAKPYRLADLERALGL